MLSELEMSKVAYLIGYLAGDGNYLGGFGKRTDRLSVTSVDEEFVDWVNEHIAPFDKSDPRLNNNFKRGIIAKKPSYIKTFPVSYSADFNRFGILCKKEGRTIQNIKKSYMKDWLRGFTDSDGCISYSIRKDRDRLICKVIFTHPSDKLLVQIQHFLMEQLEIPSAIKPKKGEKCYVLHFSKPSDVIKYCEFIYGNIDDIVITRKYNNYLDIMKELDSRINEGRQYPKEFMCSKEYGALIGSMGNTMYIDHEGTEYPSISMMVSKYKLSKEQIRKRCKEGIDGWGSRPKTTSEKEDYRKYVNRKIKQVFQQWRISNPDY